MGQKSQAGKCRNLTIDNEAQMGEFKKEKTVKQCAHKMQYYREECRSPGSNMVC